MCGIYGHQFASPLPPGPWIGALTTSLAFYNERRGGHAWGMFDSTGAVHRELGPITETFDADLAGRRQELIVHTRFATIGDSKKLENTHPFKFDHILGCHNGGIWNHKHMDTKHNRDFPVDSMHLFAHLAEGKPCGEMTGYGAVAYVDLRHPGQVHLAQFGGELAVAEVKVPVGLRRGDDITGTVFSSSKAHLESALSMAGIRLENFYIIDDGMAYCLVNGALRQGPRLFDGISTASWSTRYGGRESRRNRRGKETAGERSTVIDMTDEAYWEEFCGADRRSAGFVRGGFPIDPPDKPDDKDKKATIPAPRPTSVVSTPMNGGPILNAVGEPRTLVPLFPRDFERRESAEGVKYYVAKAKYLWGPPDPGRGGRGRVIQITGPTTTPNTPENAQ